MKFLITCGVGLLMVNGHAQRVQEMFNRDFRFSIGDNPDAAREKWDDSQWEHVGLPHSFSIPYFRSQQFFVGEGWYRKNFVVKELKPGQRTRLDFEGVFQVCDVFVNGVKAGGHEGGYTGFSIELTPFLKEGENVIAIRVDNRWRADLPPRAGEHVFSGGIYRDVRLVQTGDVMIPRNGLRLDTPNVSKGEATVAARVKLSAGKTAGNVTVAVAVTDPDQQNFVVKEVSRYLRAGESCELEVPVIKIRNPKLWDVDSPKRYKVDARVSRNGKEIDRVSTKIGLRSFRFDRDKGFFLNDRPLRLRGVNRHQDHAGWGDAVANTGHARDAALLKQAGFNFVRGSHYPHDPAFLEACDEIGLLMWSENTFWGIGGFGKDNGTWSCSAYPADPKDQPGFEKNDLRLLGEMIDDLRNHPSIIVWSMSNEPFFTDPSVMERAKTHMQALIDETHRLDPTRPAGIGGAQRSGFDKLGDVIGYNGDGAGFPKPDRPSVVAEYGSRIENRPGSYDPNWAETKGEKPEWRAGEAIWCGFHHGSIAGDMGRMGIIDYFRLPLRSWFWYRNEYAKVAPPEWPKDGKAVSLALQTDRPTLNNDGTQDAHLTIQVLGADGKRVTASPDVKLEILEGPGEFPTGPSITFQHGKDIDIRDGMAAISFRSWHGGKTKIRATSEGLTPAEVEISTTGEPAWKPELSGIWQKPRAYPALIRVQAAAPSTSKEVRDNLCTIRPASASSHQDGNPANFANDGNPVTSWRAADASVPAVWTVDLENFYEVQKLDLTTEKAGNYGYKIESSIDKENWTPIFEVSGEMPDKRSHQATKVLRARFVRVTFTSVPSNEVPAIREIQISGVQAGN